MNEYIELNIKENMPTLSDAIENLKFSMARFKKNKYKCVLVIHGYGSSGKGGIICVKARQWLKSQERTQKVRTVIFGEEFNIFNPKVIELKNRFPQLEQLLKIYNHGVTVVEL